MKDTAGLNTVALIEEHYIEGRGLPRTSVDFLRESYLSKGMLGRKSGKCGLYPAGSTTTVSVRANVFHHERDNAPNLYFLDLGVSNPRIAKIQHARRILSGSIDGRPLRTITISQHILDGILILLSTDRIYWICMGTSGGPDGRVKSCLLNGSFPWIAKSIGDLNALKEITLNELNR